MVADVRLRLAVHARPNDTLTRQLSLSQRLLAARTSESVYEERCFRRIGFSAV